MEIFTQSIKDLIEIELNKGIEDICQKELNDIKLLNINRISLSGELLDIDYNELSYFNNLQELNITNCMIDSEFMEKIISLEKLRKLNIYNCDFIDECSILFEFLKVDELIIDSSLGVNEIEFNNLDKLILRNVTPSSNIKNIKMLDISHINLKKVDGLQLENIDELIISEKDINNVKNLDINAKKIIIINDRMEKEGGV